MTRSFQDLYKKNHHGCAVMIFIIMKMRLACGLNQIYDLIDGHAAAGCKSDKVDDGGKIRDVPQQDTDAILLHITDRQED